jgi:hypothetical protein
MGFKYFRHWRKDGIATGATVSDTWTAEEDLVIKRIHIQRTDGVSLTASTFYFKISGDVYTREEVPATVLGPNVQVSPELNITIPKSAKLDWTFKNNEGATISVMVTLEVWTR